MSVLLTSDILTNRQVEKLRGVLKEADRKARMENKYIPVRDRCVIEIALRAGLKVSEILDLQDKDFNLEAKVLKLKERKLNLGNDLVDIVKNFLPIRKNRYPNRKGLFFRTVSSRQALYHIFNRWAEKASLPSRYSLESCRHFFALNLCKTEENPIKIAEILGIGYPELEKYYQLLIKGNPLNRAEKSDKSYNPGYLYLAEGKGKYKIGSSKCPNGRLESISEAKNLVFSMETDRMRKLEKEIQSKFQEKKIEGEWFDLEEDDISRIKQKLKA